jgi:hypothetical protein
MSKDHYLSKTTKRTFKKVPQFSYSVMRSVRNQGTGTSLLHSPFQTITTLIYRTYSLPDEPSGNKIQ